MSSGIYLVDKMAHSASPLSSLVEFVIREKARCTAVWIDRAYDEPRALATPPLATTPPQTEKENQ